MRTRSNCPVVLEELIFLDHTFYAFVDQFIIRIFVYLLITNPSLYENIVKYLSQNFVDVLVYLGKILTEVWLEIFTVLPLFQPPILFRSYQNWNRQVQHHLPFFFQIFTFTADTQLDFFFFWGRYFLLRYISVWIIITIISITYSNELVVLVTFCMCYNLDHLQKLTNLNLIGSG